MELALLILLCLTGLATLAAFERMVKPVRLHITSISYQPKTEHTMTTNLRSTIGQFAQIALAPVNAFGTKVKLDEDAIIAEVIGDAPGARTSVQVLNDENGDRRFLVNLIPGDLPGEYQFKIRGDAQPGEGTEILEEDFIYTATPENAVSLGATVTYLPKSSIPA